MHLGTPWMGLAWNLHGRMITQRLTADTPQRRKLSHTYSVDQMELSFQKRYQGRGLRARNNCIWCPRPVLLALWVTAPTFWGLAVLNSQLNWGVARRNSVKKQLCVHDALQYPMIAKLSLWRAYYLFYWPKKLARYKLGFFPLSYLSRFYPARITQSTSKEKLELFVSRHQGEASSPECHGNRLTFLEQ